MAQSIGLVDADTYVGRPLRIASLMQVIDDPAAGASLYRVEVDRFRVLVQKAADGDDYLFLLDEPFRGTNPIERVAASAAVLRWMVQSNLVLATTHDRVLCELLADSFDLAYLTERVEGEDVVFDYRLRPGVLDQTNAIALLERAGYPPLLVQAAREIAHRLSERPTERMNLL